MPPNSWEENLHSFSSPDQANTDRGTNLEAMNINI